MGEAKHAVAEVSGQAGPPSRVRYSAWSGPIPPPEQLEAFERVLPGAAAAILEMAANQSAHRRELEQSLVQGAIRRADRGLRYGFVTVLAVLLCGVVLVLTGHPTQGAMVLSVSLPTLGAVFVYGRRTLPDRFARSIDGGTWR